MSELIQHHVHHDPKTGYYYFIVRPSELSLTEVDGHESGSWKMVYYAETSNELVEVAELKEVTCFKVHGNFNLSCLKPNVNYEVVFVVMFKENACGWKNLKVGFKRPDCTYHQEHPAHLSRRDDEERQWFEIPVGEITTRNGCMQGDDQIQFSLAEMTDNICKKGIVIKGVIIRRSTRNSHLSGAQEIFIIPKELSIHRDEQELYWRWRCVDHDTEENGNILVDVAELEGIQDLQVRGQLNTSQLVSETEYEVAFIVKLNDSARDWKGREVHLQLDLPAGKETKCQPSNARKPTPRKEYLGSAYEGQWKNLAVGTFKAVETNAGEIQFSLSGTNCSWNVGLVIKGAVVRPICRGSMHGDDLLPQYIMVTPRDLLIAWIDDQRYWSCYTLNETSDRGMEAAELKEVCWLDVNGKLNISQLSPGIVYEVVFVVMLRNSATGWECHPVNLRLVLPNGETKEHKEWLQDKPKEQWMELNVGDFKTNPGSHGGEIKFQLIEIGDHWKKGLVIKSVIIRRKV